MEFALRDFRHEEFETLWRIDQQCFAPGISYSRLELATYLQRPGAFTLVADADEMQRDGLADFGRMASPQPLTVGFIVAETGSRGNGHIITIDVLPQGAWSGHRIAVAARGRGPVAHRQLPFRDS